MRFGLGYVTTQIPPGDTRTEYAKYHEAIEMAELADDVGFDSIWLSEHHDEDDRYLSTMFPMAAAMAQATSQITIGTAIVLAPFYEPLRLAEDAAAIDVFSDGRFEFGMSIGYRDREFEHFDIPRSERVPRMVDALEVCRRGWAGERFTYDGEVYNYDDIRVTPTPPSGTDLPIHIGAMAEPAIRRAARIADGVIIVHTPPIDQLETMFGWVEDEGAEKGEFTRILFREAFVADSDEEAWEAMKPGSYYLNNRYVEEFDRCSDDVEFPAPEEHARSWALTGSPDELVEEILEFSDLLAKDDHLVVRLEYPGMDHDVAMEAIERFGREVIPRVNAAL